MSGNTPTTLQSHRIILLAGGTSAEREISLQSGAAVQAALQQLGLETEPVDPALVDLNGFAWRASDIAFIALHGGCGENGDLQTLLEAAGVPYTGSGPEASRLAFSKSAAKLRFLQRGVPTPPFVLVHRNDSRERLLEQAARIGYPLAIKPDQQGSSLGVSIVRSAAELAAAAELCFRYGPFGVFEQAIPGTEWTLGVLDDEPLPLIRIETPNLFFDFGAKYQDDATQYVLELSEPQSTTLGITQAGLEACRALGTEGVARVDLRLDEQGRPWVLEVNTVPGLTDHSLVPKAAAKAGLGFASLCRRMLESALGRFARRQSAAASPEFQTRSWRQAG